MKVVVSRSGGFAGIRTTWEVQVEEQPDQSAWAELLAGLPWGEVTDSAPQPDRYIYRIRCAPHEVVLGEQQVGGPWKELIDRVRGVNEAH